MSNLAEEGNADLERYEMGISENNLPHWGINEALKEFIQNNIYAKVILGDETTIKHTGKYAILHNSPSGFTKGKLLVGESEQRDVTGAPGQYGEGSKIAMTVACRCGRDCAIETNGFTVFPTLDPSRLDPSVRTLTYNIQDNDITDGTTFSIECTKEELDEAMKSFAVLNGVSQEDTNQDVILPDQPNKFYVNGVLIMETDSVFGYNFIKPDLMNRDRTIADMDKIKLSVNALLRGITNVGLASMVLDHVILQDTEYVESLAGLYTWDCNKDIWKEAIRKTLGVRVALATGSDSDTKARYHQFKVLTNVPSKWRSALNDLGVPYTSELEVVAEKPKNRHVKPDADESTTLGWCKRLIKLYIGDYGTVRISEKVTDEHGNECLGLYDRKTDIIWLQHEILSSKKLTWKVLLHEVLHRLTRATDNSEAFTEAWEDATWGILMRGKDE